MDEDVTSNSSQDKEKTTDLSDSTDSAEGKEKEIKEDEKLGHKDCDPMDVMECTPSPMCVCSCKSEDTGKQIDFKC